MLKLAKFELIEFNIERTDSAIPVVSNTKKSIFIILAYENNHA